MGELTVWIVFPTVAILMYRSSPLVPLDSCLTAAACFSSACSFAVSQASDLALLVGYVTKEDFNFIVVVTILDISCSTRNWRHRCEGGEKVLLLEELLEAEGDVRRAVNMRILEDYSKWRKISRNLPNSRNIPLKHRGSVSVALRNSDERPDTNSGGKDGSSWQEDVAL